MDIASQLEKRIDVGKTVSTLESNGFCFFESLLDKQAVNQLNDEFRQTFSELPEGVTEGSHPPGRMATIDVPTCRRRSLPAIFSLFMSPMFRSIAKEILPQGSHFNDKIALTNESKVMPITDIHFDSQRSLKFFIYLLDTDESNGAFSYVKGSNITNAAYRKKYLSQGGHLLDLQNVAASEESKILQLEPIVGPAGSMIVFDTDGWHSAGRLQDEEKERRVIRSRSIFADQPILYPKRYSPLWFRRKLNIFPPRPPFEIDGRGRTGASSRKK